MQGACMCGLPFGIIVDANRILIDQACEPLTIAGRTDPAREKTWAETALALARGLEEGQDFTLEADQHLRLTETGRLKLEAWASDLPGAWRNAHRRGADVCLALQALRLEPGRHYRLAGQGLELPSGVSMPDGMIQLLQAREGLPVSGRAAARGKLTFQRFFRRYESLAAVCGDVHHIRDELWHIYGLPGFVVTPAASNTVADDDAPGKTEQHIVAAVSMASESLGRYTGSVLSAWRMRRRRKAAEQIRRHLLRLDNQIGNITAFSGRSE
jgi:preprotein translocase subunit SecA